MATKERKTPVKSDDFWAGIETLVLNIQSGRDLITNLTRAAKEAREEPTVEV